MTSLYQLSPVPLHGKTIQLSRPRKDVTGLQIAHLRIEGTRDSQGHHSVVGERLLDRLPYPGIAYMPLTRQYAGFVRIFLHEGMAPGLRSAF